MNPPEGESSGEWVAIGLLARTRGIRGELIAIPVGAGPERFEALERVWLFGPDPASPQGSRYEIESVWIHDGRPVLKFRGIDSITQAEALAGAEIRLPISERTPLEPGEFYQADLIGCAVVQSGGEHLGEVVAWHEHGGPALLEIRTVDGGELLIPFARSICTQIDTDARRIVVELPQGLKELNRD